MNNGDHFIRPSLLVWKNHLIRMVTSLEMTI